MLADKVWLRVRRAANDQRRRGNPTMAVLGNSIAGACRGASTDWLDMADAEAGFVFRRSVVSAVGGQTTEQIRRRLHVVIEARPDWCIVEGGGNDITAHGRPAVAVVDDLRAMYEELAGKGIGVVATTVLPSTYLDTDDKRSTLLEVNRWIASQRLPVCNWSMALSRGDVFTIDRSLAPDGVHPNSAGARSMSTHLAGVFRSITG